MKKFTIFLFAITLSISCSDESVELPEETSEFPTELSLSLEAANIGDVLTINGNGFMPGETYVITFNDNIIGTIIEITSDFIRVEVPEGAQSGNITLTFGNVTIIIGIIIIEDNTDTENVYLFYESGGFLVELNIETGELEFINQFASGGETIGAVYNQQTNEYIIFFNNTDPNYIRVNLETGEPTFHAIDPSFSIILGDGTDVFSGPVIDNNGNVYLFYESGGFLVELNIETGELEFINQFASGGETIGAVYNQQTNEYIVLFNNTDPNYIRVNLTTLELNFEAIDPSFSFIQADGQDGFRAPTIDADGNVNLVYENLNSVMELDIETGELNIIADGFNGGATLGAVYNSETNEYIAFFNNTDPNYIRLNPETLELNFQPIDPSFSLIAGDGTDVFNAVVIGADN